MSRVIFLLFALVAVSACVSTVGLQNDGITITDFRIEPTGVESGEPFTVTMIYENVGERAAENVQASLHGLGVSLFDQPYSSFFPVDFDKNRPGQSGVATWTLVAPTVQAGTTGDYRFVGRVEYLYSTSATALIPYATRDEFRSQQASGTVQSLQQTATAGPLAVDINGDVPLIIRPDDVSFTTFQITLRDVGSGVPISDGVQGLVKGTITFSGADQIFCFDSEPLVNDDGSITYALPPSMIIRQGDSVSFSCTLDAGNIPRTFGTITAAFDLFYGYFTETEGVLSVSGVTGSPFQR